MLVELFKRYGCIFVKFGQSVHYVC